MDDIRLDKYLWAVRVFKTRSDAADAIRTNKVTVNGSFAKPSREVKIGDLIAVRKRQVTYSYKVLGLVSSRQGARNVPDYCLDVTPQEELAKLDLFARRREGVNEGHWCILDYGDVMVHIFHEQDREYYQLERLWSNGANEVEVALDGAGAAEA